MTTPMLIDKLKYVHEDTDRHLNKRIYVWLGKGHKKYRIREEFGTEAFRKAYDEALKLARSEPVEDTRSRAPKVGTYRWMCARFMSESAEFKGLADSTRTVRRQVIENTYDEPIAPGATETFADFPLNRMTPKIIRILRDRKIDTPHAANTRIKALRQIFKWALENDVQGVTTNPAKDVSYFSSPSDGFHTWTEEEVAQFEEVHELGSKPRLALALLLYTGVRRSDLVLMGRQMVRAGWIHFMEQKGRTQKIKERQIPMLPALQAVIDASPAGNLTFLVTEYGAPFTAAGFGNWFRQRCNEAGLKHCSAHGLRKAGATMAAENGATEHELMAIFGWENPKQAAVYTRKANRKKLAGRSMHHLMAPAKQ